MFENAAYRLELAANGRYVTLATKRDGRLLSLSLLAAVHRTDGADETLAVLPPQVNESTIVVERRSTLWERAWVEVHCLDDSVELHTQVRGRGDVTEVRLLGGRSLIPGSPLGHISSGTHLRTLFTPNPEDGAGHVRALAEGAVIGVLGDGEPGRGRWLFTPAPLYFALAEHADATSWLDLAIAAPVEELRFGELALEVPANGFSLKVDYDSQTSVDGDFRAPVLLITPAVPDPYAGLRRHRADLAARAVAPPPRPRQAPAWWTEPIFCGWGAQCYVASVSGGSAQDQSTQERYDAFLAVLEKEGLVPGTIVLDDKWQATYGGNEPDPQKWPDLPGWIADRQAGGQHVLLWWKAWDPEGLAPELCVRNPDGSPVALDPSNPAARDELRRIVGRMLARDGLGGDGLKVDFTARTPSGRALSHHGGGAWGIALLHELLSVVYAAAKDAKPDALVITHTPHPSFVDVTDMIRLNDLISGEVVAQMAFRAAVVGAACPELLIDTDDWRVPDKRAWRAFLDVKAEMGVPSLYYASHLDATGEELGADDYAALRSVWEEWKEHAA